MTDMDGAAGAPSRAGLLRILDWVGIAFLLLTLGATLAGMAGRYLRLPHLEGSFELAALGFVWLTFIGTVIAEIRNENVRFEGLSLLLPPAGRRALDWISALVLVGVSLWLLRSGLAMLQQSGTVPTPVLRWPSGLMGGALVSAALMLALIAAWRVLRLLGRFDRDAT